MRSLQSLFVSTSNLPGGGFLGFNAGASREWLGNLLQLRHAFPGLRITEAKQGFCWRLLRTQLLPNLDIGTRMASSPVRNKVAKVETLKGRTVQASAYCNKAAAVFERSKHFPSSTMIAVPPVFSPVGTVTEDVAQLAAKNARDQVRAGQGRSRRT